MVEAIFKDNALINWRSNGFSNAINNVLVEAKLRTWLGKTRRDKRIQVFTRTFIPFIGKEMNQVEHRTLYLIDIIHGYSYFGNFGGDCVPFFYRFNKNWSIKNGLPDSPHHFSKTITIFTAYVETLCKVLQKIKRLITVPT